MSIFNDWKPQQIEAFRRDNLLVNHNLHKSALFDDASLAELLDHHPVDKLDVCMMPDVSKGDIRFRTGDFREADGETLINLVQQGEVWINMREAMNIHPRYKAVLDQMYGEISEKTNMRFFRPRGGILISSPAAKVPYHVDTTETMLWHIRGEKSVFVYPKTKDFLSETEYEEQIVNEVNSYLTYSPDMDKSAFVHDLQAGEMMCWPLNTPHKVVNKSYCVSIATEYSSWESKLKNSAIYTNAVLRRKFNQTPNWEGANAAERMVKSAIGYVLRSMNVIPEPPDFDMVSFRIHKNIPGYIEPVTPYARNF